MTAPLSPVLLAQLSAFVADQLGLNFPERRWHDLERAIQGAAPELGFANSATCIEYFSVNRPSKNQIEILASHLTVGETYFFREKKSFEALEGQILPELFNARRKSDRRLRFWSAGCCTGEEAYSFAILLHKLLPDLQAWHTTILATDINPHFLHKAAQGLYSDWSFREKGLTAKDRFFTKVPGGRYEILPEIKKMVSFSYLNLAEDAYPSLLNNTNAMDIIFCRNVLMYFTPERARQVVGNFYRSLTEGGWLVVSPTETSPALFAQFETVNFPGLILYRRGTQKPAIAREMTPTLIEVPQPLSWPAEFASTPTEITRPTTWPEEPTPALEAPPLPPNPRQPYLDALVFYNQGQQAEAARLLHDFLDEQPADVKALTLLARVYANEGNLAEARTWCEQALKLDKLDPASHYLYATIQAEQEQPDAATASLKRALYLDRNFAVAHFALGNLVQRQGKAAEARKHFENTLAVLAAYRNDELLPEADGMTAGRLTEIVKLLVNQENAV